MIKKETYIVYLQSTTTLGVPVEACNEGDAIETALETIKDHNKIPFCYYNATDFSWVDVEKRVKE